MAQTIGIIDIVWGGRKIPVEKGAKLKPGGIKNNAVIVGRQVDRAQEFIASEITAVTRLARGQRFSSLYATGENELQVQCDTGHTYTFPSAFLTDIPEITGGEGGKLELKWMAGDYEEVLS